MATGTGHGAGRASGMFPHIRVSWSGWLRARGPVSRVRGRRHLLSRGSCWCGTAGFEPATPCSQRGALTKLRHVPCKPPRAAVSVLGAAEASSKRFKHHRLACYGAAMSEPRLPDWPAPSSGNLRAETKSDRTVETTLRPSACLKT